MRNNILKPTYQQPKKKAIREKMLVHAVKVLTTSRRASTLVRLSELKELIQFASTRLTEIGLTRLGLDSSVLGQLEAELDPWTKLYKSHIGRKTPAQLKVLYLCGPEPLNDLQVLLSCGIDPHNVWAVESNKANFEIAIAELNASGIPLKIHPGNLNDLLSTYPESFDIIYFDACGPSRNLPL